MNGCRPRREGSGRPRPGIGVGRIHRGQHVELDAVRLHQARRAHHLVRTFRVRLCPHDSDRASPPAHPDSAQRAPDARGNSHHSGVSSVPLVWMVCSIFTAGRCSGARENVGGPALVWQRPPTSVVTDGGIMTGSIGENCGENGRNPQDCDQAADQSRDRPWHDGSIHRREHASCRGGAAEMPAPRHRSRSRS